MCVCVVYVWREITEHMRRDREHHEILGIELTPFLLQSISLDGLTNEFSPGTPGLEDTHFPNIAQSQ